MSDTTKVFNEFDQTQIMQKVYNPADGTLAIGGFVNGKIGHKITRTAVSSTIEDWKFYDGSTLLLTIRITYDDASHTNIEQVERIS